MTLVSNANTTFNCNGKSVTLPHDIYQCLLHDAVFEYGVSVNSPEFEEMVNAHLALKP